MALLEISVIFIGKSFDTECFGTFDIATHSYNSARVKIILLHEIWGSLGG
jgi:hypothetical protein